MADVLPLKLIDLGSGQGELHEFEAGDMLPPAVVGFIGSPYAAYSGTANAIVLTTAARFPAKVALAVGDQVRFRASSANTGATTINWDGQGAIACRTVTNVALPSGYIRTDADTVAAYDGTYFVLGREIERGSSASGKYTRLADGTAYLSGPYAPGTLSWSSGVGVRYAQGPNITLPAAILPGGRGVVFIANHDVASLSATCVLADIGTSSITQIYIAAPSGTTGVAINQAGSFTVSGSWY